MYIVANGTKTIEHVVEVEQFPTGDIYYTSTGKSYIRSQFKTIDEVCNEMGYDKFKNKASIEGKGNLLSKLDMLNLLSNYSNN